MDAALTFFWRKRRSTNPSQGFTLIELMIAITIVAVLATIGLIMLQGAQKIARDAKRKSDLEDIKKAFYAYKNVTGTFCLSGTGTCGTPLSFAINDTIDGFSGTCAGATWCLKNTIANYLRGNSVNANANACDPKNNNCAAASAAFTTDYWVVITGDDKIDLSAVLEGVNASAPAITGQNATRACTFGTNRNYCITE